MGNGYRYGGRRRQGGLAAVEMAIVSLLLMTILCAVIDLSRAIITQQVMANVSRETSNLASRGTPIDQAGDAALDSAAPLKLDESGYLIVTEVGRDSDGNLIVMDQIKRGGAARGSRVGGAVDGPANLPATSTPLPTAGQSLFVTEIFYNSRSIAPGGSHGHGLERGLLRCGVLLDGASNAVSS